MNIRFAGWYAAVVLASPGSAVVPPPVPPQYSTLQDRAPQIMQMQLAAPAGPGSSGGMAGAEASVMAKRFINGDTRAVPTPVSTSSSSMPQ